jgi:hypothetical protein
MKIKYPPEFKKKPIRVNAYGEKAWGEVNYQQPIPCGFKQVGSIDYIRGYRDAIRDVKKLNRKERVHK